jgi:hypothetical protein
MKYLRRFCLQSQEGIALPKRITGGGFGAWLMLVAHCLSPETECPHWGHLMVIVTVWCLIVVLQLGPGMCLLSNVQVHFDCAGSRNVWAPVVGHGIFCWELSRRSSFRICFFYSSTAQTRSKLRRGSLAVSQGRRIRFLFFFRRRHRDFCRKSCAFYFL